MIKKNQEIPTGKLIQSDEQFLHTQRLAEELKDATKEKKKEVIITLQDTCLAENRDLDNTLKLYKKNLIICIS